VRTREKIRVGVLGATGTVGQRFVTLLDRHPWFELVALTASERSAGKPYADSVTWVQGVPPSDRVADMAVLPTEPIEDCPLVFSALDAGVAGPIEEAMASAGHFVVSNARNHRMDPLVPLMVPEVNPDHLDLVSVQQFEHGGGAIVTNPNCSTIGLVLALKPLQDAFGLDAVHVVTLQAVSGAGLPGVPSYAILDNVIPFIAGEEEKMEAETRKILGTLSADAVQPVDLAVSAQCTRVPVVDGHTACVSVRLRRETGPDEIVAAWREFVSDPQALQLPSAPARPILYFDREDAPQPRLHRDLQAGMSVAIGRLRPCPLLGWKFVALSHNTVRGAAGGALLVAELAVARQLLDA
jgi:aspartate-semialdehyde dehydrogenase